MADSDNARWATHFLEEATNADPDRADMAQIIATAGVGFALLAIADAINNHAETIANQQTGDGRKRN